jgi:hypothetical protein
LEPCLNRFIRKLRGWIKKLFQDPIFFSIYSFFSLYFIYSQLSIDWASQKFYFSVNSEILDKLKISIISVWAKIFYTLSFLIKILGFCGDGKKSIIFNILKLEFFLFFTFLSEKVFFLNNLRIPLFLIELLNQFNPRLAIYKLGLIKYLFGYVAGFFLFLLFSNFIFTDFEIKLFGNDLTTDQSNQLIRKITKHISFAFH